MKGYLPWDSVVIHSLVFSSILREVFFIEMRLELKNTAKEGDVQCLKKTGVKEEIKCGCYDERK